MVIPHHVAIILDGNGRWAQNLSKKRIFGHQEGANAVRRTVTAAAELGVKELTLFAFSSENWKRPTLEVNALMTLFVKAIRSECKNLFNNGICTKVIGDISRFPYILQSQIRKLEEMTSGCSVMRLNIAANYGGRWDIMQAFSSLARQLNDNKINLSELNEDLISQNMSIKTDVDLMIRTGGEKRISNFLLWQSAYAELYFTDTLWPDFDKKDLIEAFRFFSGRERRFGMTSAQVKNKG